MKTVRLSAEKWPGVLASRAHSFRDRFLGIKSGDSERALLIGGRSVHSFGLHKPLRLVGLDRDMRVIDTRTLPPKRVAYFASARFILELEESATTPLPGSVVEVSDV